MLNIYKYVLIALSIVIQAGAASAIPLEEWNRTYGDTGDDRLSDLRQTADGGYIISGSTCLNNTASCEGLLIKTDAKGNVGWKRTYSGSIRSVRQTMDGGYIAIGYLYPIGIFHLFRTDGKGSILWNRTYNGSTLTRYRNEWGQKYYGTVDYITSVLQTGDGGYIAAGSIKDMASGHLDAWLLRTDADGGELWSNKYGGVGNEHITSFQRTQDGGYLLNIWGASELFKTDADGNELWNRKIKPPAGYPNYILQTRDGGYVMAGSIGDESGYDAWFARTDADFNTQFSRQFRESQFFNSAYSIIETSDGGYLMVVDANLRAMSEDNYEMMLIRTDNNGSKLWSRRFKGGNSGVVQQTQDGGYIFGSTRFSAGVKEIWITKLESDMNLSSLPWSAPVYSPDELRNSTEIPVKYLDDINEGDIKAVLDAAAREIRTFDGSRYESIRASLSLEGETLRESIWVKLFIFEFEGYREGKKESRLMYVEHFPEKERNTSVIMGLSDETLVPAIYLGIAKSIALKTMESLNLNMTPELAEASWRINMPGIVILKFKDPESPAYTDVTIDLRNRSVESVVKKYWFQPSFPIYFNITSDPVGADVYLAKSGLGDLCGGTPYKLSGDLIGKTPLTYKYEYNQTFIPLSGLFSLFSFNLAGLEDAFKCVNIYGGESASELSVSIYPDGSLEPVSETPLSYNISAGLKPEKKINRDAPGFEFVFLIWAFLLIYFLGSRKVS